MSNIIYLHGFMSSPQSAKAVQTMNYIEQHHPECSVHVPQLSGYPDLALNQIEDLVKNAKVSENLYIGSSMGGFLATYLVERYGGRAVLVNPAVAPAKLLAEYLGVHINPYTQEQITLTEAHLHYLMRMDVAINASPQRYKVLLQQGDETLDYRLAEEKYAGATMLIEQGGNHSFVDYAKHLPQIMDFLLTK